MRERRYKKVRKPHKIFLVVCEGETEAEYIKMLRQNYRIPVTIKTKISGNAICHRLVNQYFKELGLGKDEECRIFYVYDADVECIVDRLRGLPGTLVLSNPSIELWYLLHTKTHSRSETSEKIVRALVNSDVIWKSYAKGILSSEQRQFLTNGCSTAIARARKMNWPENPSSNMYLFIEALEEENL